MFIRNFFSYHQKQYTVLLRLSTDYKIVILNLTLVSICFGDRGRLTVHKVTSTNVGENIQSIATNIFVSSLSIMHFLQS